MPDEVNIDELLQLDSEDERSRKIQVGGEKGEKAAPSLPGPTFCRALNGIAQVGMFIKHVSARH